MFGDKIVPQRYMPLWNHPAGKYSTFTIHYYHLYVHRTYTLTYVRTYTFFQRVVCTFVFVNVIYLTRSPSSVGTGKRGAHKSIHTFIYDCIDEF